ncbi:hypothetical protein [Dietzia natronolimnaea]|uniref:hypothetical protein n=1 Tax=Dietzia natronolimnaea TaxID=161920 RepID=UPI0015FA5009|nr:hypothetical protein [Dietzia natronolimnaea]MBB1037660.1 hypothetical protein [Dietzia natronolimnaea]
MTHTHRRTGRLIPAALGAAMALGLSTVTAHADPGLSIAATAETTPGSDTVTLSLFSNFDAPFACFYSINPAAEPTPSNLWTDNPSAVVPAASSAPWNHSQVTYTHHLTDGDYAVYWQCNGNGATNFADFGNFASPWTPTPTADPVTFSIDTSPPPPADPECQGSACLLPLIGELLDALPRDPAVPGATGSVG